MINLKESGLDVFGTRLGKKTKIVIAAAVISGTILTRSNDHESYQPPSSVNPEIDRAGGVVYTDRDNDGIPDHRDVFLGNNYSITPEVAGIQSPTAMSEHEIPPSN